MMDGLPLDLVEEDVGHHPPFTIPFQSTLAFSSNSTMGTFKSFENSG